MGLWGKSSEIAKNLIKLNLIEIIQLCLKNYDLWTQSPPQMPTSVDFLWLIPNDSSRSLCQKSNIWWNPLTLIYSKSGFSIW